MNVIPRILDCPKTQGYSIYNYLKERKEEKTEILGATIRECFQFFRDE